MAGDWNTQPESLFYYEGIIWYHDFDVHLSRNDRTTIEGYLHVAGAQYGSKVTVEIPELRAVDRSTLSENGRATIRLTVENLTLWTPKRPKLYRVYISNGPDHLQDEIGFRTMETRGSQILLNGEPRAADMRSDLIPK